MWPQMKSANEILTRIERVRVTMWEMMAADIRTQVRVFCYKLIIVLEFRLLKEKVIYEDYLLKKINAWLTWQ